MITRKHLLFAIAATSLLTMFLITIVPIRSQNAGEYDPWLDWNDDGKINLIDVFRTELAFGTSGDPTKNVNVTNWPTNWPQTYNVQTFTFNISNSGGDNIATIFCGSYSKLSILFGTQVNASIGAGNNVTIFSENIQWCDQPSSWPCTTMEYLDSRNFNATILNGDGWVWLKYPYPTPFVTETKAPYCHFLFGWYTGGTLPANWWVTFSIAVYLRNE